MYLKNITAIKTILCALLMMTTATMTSTEIEDLREKTSDEKFSMKTENQDSSSELIFKFTSKYPLLALLDTSSIKFNNDTTINSAEIDNINTSLAKNLFRNLRNPKVSGWEASRKYQRQINEINIYLTAIICFTGIIGNLLSLKVFCSTKLRRTSSITYLIALTITDSLFLMVHFLDNTCRDIVTHFRIEFPLNIIDQKVTICRAFSLIRSACRCASPWIIVAFTMERFVVVNYPIHANIISRPLLAKRLILIIFALSILISLYAPALSGIVYYAKKNSLSNRLYAAYKKAYKDSIFKNMQVEEMFFEKSCDILASYRMFYIYLTLAYTVIVVVTPLIIVSILNTLLVFRLYRSTDQWTSAKLKLHEQEMSYKELRDKKVQIENLKITWTLIIISVSFILLTLPHTVLYFIWTIPKLSKEDQHSWFFFNISPNVMKFTELLYVLNHAINFFLYTITRNSFRNILKDQFRLDCFKNLHLDYKHGKGNAYKLKHAGHKFTFIKHSNAKLDDTNNRDSFHVNKINTEVEATKNCYAPDASKPEYENYWDIMPLNKTSSNAEATLTKSIKNKKKKDNKNLLKNT